MATYHGGMWLFVLLVLIGVTLTLLMGIVIALVLGLGARTSTQDVTEEPVDAQRSDSGRRGEKETP